MSVTYTLKNLNATYPELGRSWSYRWAVAHKIPKVGREYSLTFGQAIKMLADRKITHGALLTDSGYYLIVPTPSETTYEELHRLWDAKEEFKERMSWYRRDLGLGTLLLLSLGAILTVIFTLAIRG